MNQAPQMNGLGRPISDRRYFIQKRDEDHAIKYTLVTVVINSAVTKYH
jgi:hypothetical protein